MDQAQPLGADAAALFRDEEEARAFFERMRWSGAVTCPLCRAEGLVYWCNEPAGSADWPAPDRRTNGGRHGAWKCGSCRRRFTVTVRTILQSTHIPLHKWLYAIHLLCQSPHGVDAKALETRLSLCKSSAYLLFNRLGRVAMDPSIEPLRLRALKALRSSQRGARRSRRDISAAALLAGFRNQTGRTSRSRLVSMWPLSLEAAAKAVIVFDRTKPPA